MANRKQKFESGIIKFIEDVFGPGRVFIHGTRCITAEVVGVSVDRAQRVWLKLAVRNATGHRAAELDQYIRRSLKTVEAGMSRHLSGKPRSQKQSKKRR